MDLKEIKELIKLVNQSEVGLLQLEKDDFKIKIIHKDCYSKNQGQAPVMYTPQAYGNPVSVPTNPIAKEEAPQSTESSAPKVEDNAASNGNYVTVHSPMIGTFYRSPGPDKDPYVKVGDTVSKGDVLCVIEAMKLFNEIECETTGKIIKVLIDNASPVEYDQPLFLIDPI